MSAFQPHVYRFASRKTWKRCVLHRIEARRDGLLVPVARLGRRAHHAIADVGVSAVAVDRHGRLLWRRSGHDASGGAWARWLNALGVPARPFRVDEILAASPRWLVDRRWLWAFDPRRPQVARFDRETLEIDRTIELARCRGASDSDPMVVLERVLDVATDREGGLWVLARAADAVEWLVHVDCRGAARARWRTPAQAGPIRQIAATSESLVLLPTRGRLWFVALSDGTVTYRLLPPGVSEWAPSRLAADGGNRIVLGGLETLKGRARWILVVLDGAGDLLDGPRRDLFDPEPAAFEAARASHDPDVVPADLAVSGDETWLATADGLWRLDATMGSGAQESRSMLLTPLLVSPVTSTYRGWLRAELSIDLPKGAVLEAEYRCTNDPRVAKDVQDVLADRTLTSEEKQEKAWSKLEERARQRVRLSDPTSRATPLAIPLFECQDQWLFLRLTLTVPPDTGLPKISMLRVIHPDVSIAQHLPAIVRGEDGDPTGFLRRLVGVLESTTQRLDERIRSIGSAIDPETAPVDWLDYLARWMSLPWDDALPEAAKRCILLHAGDILERRGTRAGLAGLLNCVAGKGKATIRDDAAEHPPIRLGDAACAGGALPAVLAGASARIPVLGSLATIGGAHLACPTMDRDPLRNLVPRLRVTLKVPRKAQEALEPILAALLAQYLPADLPVKVAWRVQPARQGDAGDDGMILEEDGPGRLNEDSIFGRTLIGGRDRGRVMDVGITVGFRLH